MPSRVRRFGRFIYKVILNYFLQGLIILAPIIITAYTIYLIFDKVDSILRPRVNIPGLGFLIILGAVVLVGWVSSFFVLGRVLSFFENWLERAPGVKFIYSALRDFFEAFAGEKRKFDHPVLVNIKGEDVWQVGFVTKEDMTLFEMADYVAVYVPQSYAVAGNLYVVPPSKVKRLPRISAADAMRFAISGGVTEIEEAHDVDNTVNRPKAVPEARPPAVAAPAKANP